jgi:apolipoprotein N-acyltransferase
LAALAGVAVATGQAPLNFWWAALPGLAALIHLISHAPNARAAVWLGLWGGAGQFVLSLSWIVEPFLIDPETYGWMAPFALVFIAFGLSLFWAAAAGLSQLLPRNRALGFALALTVTEMTRGWVLTGFPWALIGHIWIGTPVAQIAAALGPNALTLLATLLAALPIAFRWRGVMASALLFVTAFGIGLARLAEPDPTTDLVTLRLVQPNAEQHLKWDPQRALFYFDRQLALTAADPKPGEPAPDLVVWPETAVPYLLNRPGAALIDIAYAAADRPVIVGIQRSDDTRGWNSLALIGAGGAVDAVYDKHHLVPFGEYIPFGDLAYRLFGIQAFAAQQGNGYSAGRGAVTIDLGPKLGLTLPLICYEAVFPQDVAATPNRPRFILHITNDAWFGKINGPYQHLAQARLRAIEQGLPLARAANTGVTAMIDAKGRVTAALPMGVSDALDATLPAALPPTPYARHGELPFVLLLIGLVLAVTFHRRARSA